MVYKYFGALITKAELSKTIIVSLVQVFLDRCLRLKAEIGSTL